MGVLAVRRRRGPAGQGRGPGTAAPVAGLRRGARRGGLDHPLVGEARGDARVRRGGLRPAPVVRRRGRGGPAPRAGRRHRRRGRRCGGSAAGRRPRARGARRRLRRPTSRTRSSRGRACSWSRTARRSASATALSSCSSPGTRRPATLALWAALVHAPPGTTALVLFMTAAQQWAIRVALDARLPLSPDGPRVRQGDGSGRWRRSCRAGRSCSQDAPASRLRSSPTSLRAAVPFEGGVGPAPRASPSAGRSEARGRGPARVEVRAARRAQPGAVGTAQHLRRAARARARRAPTARRSSSSPSTYGLSRSSSPPPGWSISRASTATVGAASSRQRMHGPRSAASKRRRSDQPLPVIREMSSRTGHDRRLGHVALLAVAEAAELDLEVDALPLTGAQVQPGEVEAVGSGGHRAFRVEPVACARWSSTSRARRCGRRSCRIPFPATAQLLLRVRACGVCRTDVHVRDGEVTTTTRPIVPGHQIVGVVERGGPGHAHPDRDARRRALARLDRRHVRVLHERPREPVHGRTLHGPGHPRRVRRADGRRRALSASRSPTATTTWRSHRCCAPGLIGHRALRMTGDARRLGLYGFGAAAHIVAQVGDPPGPHGPRLHARAGRGRRRPSRWSSAARRPATRSPPARSRSTRRSSSPPRASSSRRRCARATAAASSSAPGST